MRDLRIVFMGTPEISVASLVALIKNKSNVVAVITAPDRHKGRGQKLIPSPVKSAALENGIPVLQPTNLKSAEFLAELASYEANLQVVVAFRMLPEVVWSMPEYGTFNLHASLLPQYRGAAPINWAIINGETETGVTTFFLQHEIDTGDLIKQVTESIRLNDNVGDLYERLMQKGGELVAETINLIAKDAVNPTPQKIIGALKSAPKIFKVTCKIDWSNSAESIRNFVRGLNPYPTAWTTLNGESCKIFVVSKADTGNADSPVGAVATDGKTYLKVKSSDGWLAIENLQRQGKKRLAIEEFLRGNEIDPQQNLLA
jgi:methionyl-tRNA formyltransferase